jgi:hypothetical protein
MDLVLMKPSPTQSFIKERAGAFAGGARHKAQGLGQNDLGPFVGAGPSGYKTITEYHGREPVGESVPLSFPSLDGRGEGEGEEGSAYHLSPEGVRAWVSTWQNFSTFTKQ